jgi:hypothetical protein
MVYNSVYYCMLYAVCCMCICVYTCYIHTYTYIHTLYVRNALISQNFTVPLTELVITSCASGRICAETTQALCVYGLIGRSGFNRYFSIDKVGLIGIF